MTTPILTDVLIDRVLQVQRRVLRPPNGHGHSAWPFRATAALATLSSEGWGAIGWIERVSETTTRNRRYEVQGQVDTGEVRLGGIAFSEVSFVDDVPAGLTFEFELETGPLESSSSSRQDREHFII